MNKKHRVVGNIMGFTPVELAFAAIIFSVLISFVIPRVHVTVERSRAGESFTYLAAVKSVQERYHARNGSYSKDLSELAFKLPAPRFFSVGTIDTGSTGSIQDSWTLTLTREGGSDSFGAYTVCFTEEGFNNNPATSTIADADHSPLFPL